MVEHSLDNFLNFTVLENDGHPEVMNREWEAMAAEVGGFEAISSTSFRHHFLK